MPTHALPWTLAAPASPRVFEPLLPVTRAVDWSLLWTSICPRRRPFGLMMHFIASESCMCTYISSQRRFTAQEHILSDQLAEARRLNLFMVPCSPPAAQETVTDGHVSFAQACSAVPHSLEEVLQRSSWAHLQRCFLRQFSLRFPGFQSFC